MSRTRKEVLTEFRTAEILQAAHRIFAERGFEQATIADIAAAAGVAKGTVYLYYRSKREVYAAVLRRDLLALRDQTRTQVEAADGIEEKVRAFITTKLRYLDDHRDFYRIYFTELGRTAARQSQSQRQLEEIYLDQVQLLEQVLHQAMKRRQVRHLRPDATARAIFDLTRSVIAQRLQGLSRATLDEDVAFAFDFVWKGIALR